MLRLERESLELTTYWRPTYGKVHLTIISVKLHGINDMKKIERFKKFGVHLIEATKVLV
jgi:hypothetical protein